MVAGERLIDLVIKRLESQTNGPIAINAPQDLIKAPRRYSIITDLCEGDIGPLAGLHTALVWAGRCGYDAVITGLPQKNWPMF